MGAARASWTRIFQRTYNRGTLTSSLVVSVLAQAIPVSLTIVEDHNVKPIFFIVRNQIQTNNFKIDFIRNGQTGRNITAGGETPCIEGMHNISKGLLVPSDYSVQT